MRWLEITVGNTWHVDATDYVRTERHMDAFLYCTVWWCSLCQIALKLTQMQGPSRKFRQPILDIIIRNMYADVVDRKWDTQGSVSMGEVTVLDYITVGMCGCISPPLVLTSLHQKVLLHPPPLFPSSIPFLPPLCIPPSVISLFPGVNVFFHIILSCESSLSPSNFPSCAWSYRLSRWAHSSSADWGTSWWQLHLNKICQGELILISLNHYTAEGTRIIG